MADAAVEILLGPAADANGQTYIDADVVAAGRRSPTYRLWRWRRSERDIFVDKPHEHLAAAGDGGLGRPDRTAIVSGGPAADRGELSALADGGAGVMAASGAEHVAYVGTGGAMLPLLMFSSARPDVPFTPMNYRLSADGLRALIDRLPDPLVVVDDEYRDMVAGAGERVMDSDEFTSAAARPPNRLRSSPIPTMSRSCCSPPAPRRDPKPLS